MSLLFVLAAGLVGGAFWFWQQENNAAQKAQARVQAAAAGDITTFAGDGTFAFVADGVAANTTSIGESWDTAVDGLGNVYIAATSQSRIRKVDTSGIITTVAGTGVNGGAGDGGAATSAELFNPRGVAVDNAGNIYIADINNNRIRKVTASTGNISTVAGSGSPGFSGDSGPAISAELNIPSGVYVDSAGNIYIGDLGNDRVRKVDTGGTITTVAGGGGSFGDGGPATSAQLSQPAGVFVDASGNLYIADLGNNRVRKVDTGGTITTFAGNGSGTYSGDGGPATSAGMLNPSGVEMDAAGNLYIADINGAIRKVDTGGTITTVAGTGVSGFFGDGGSATSAQLNQPRGISVDGAGNLFISDLNNKRIRKVEAAVVALPPFSYSFGSAGAGNGQFSFPDGIVTDSAGNIYVADSNNQRIEKFNSSGVFVSAWGSFGTGDGQFKYPAGIAIDAANNVYVADNNNNRIQKFNSSGTFLLKWGKNGGDGTSGSGDGEFAFPNDIAIDAAGNLYVADFGNARVQIFTAGGVFIRKFSVSSVRSLAVDSRGDIYIPDYNGNAIEKRSSNGTLLFTWGTSGSGNGQFQTPYSVYVDESDMVYITDMDNNRIQKFNYLGTFIDKMGKNGGDGTSGSGHGEFSSPRAVSVDAAGVVYVADTSNNRVEVFDAANPFAFALQSTTPTTNAVNVAASSTIAFLFNDSLNTATVTTANLPVFSSKRGFIGGTFAFSTTTFTDDTATFTPTVPLQAGEEISFTATANILNTLAAAISPYEGNFYVASTAGGGSYVVSSYTTGTGNGGICAADFDHDGLPDIAVSDTVSALDGVSVYLNTGGGVFAAPVHTDLTQTFGVGFTCDDLNNDGFPDLAFPNGPLNVYLGNGDGTFTLSGTYPLTDDSYGITAVDFNGDGALDIAVGQASNTSGFDVLLNSGTGTFGAAALISAGGTCTSNVGLCTLTIADGDFNNDGKADVVLLDIDGNQYVTVLGNGNGTFQSPAAPAALTGSSFRWVMTGDLNNDGNLDFVPINGGSGRFEVVLGNGDGTFQAAVPYALSFGGGTSTHGALADMDADGSLDVIIATAGANNVQAARNNGSGVFTAFPDFIIPGANYVSVVTTADFNGDGAVDLAHADYTENKLFVSINDTVAPQVTLIQPNGGQSLIQGTSYPIQWMATDNTGTVSTVNLALTTDDATYNPILGATGLPSIDYPFVLQWGASGSGPGEFGQAYGIAADSANNIYVTDYNLTAPRVQKFSSTGTFITQWGSFGGANGQFAYPTAIATDSSNNIYVAECSGNRIQKFDSSGVFILKWGTAGTGDGQFGCPTGLAIDAAGNVYVGDTNNSRVQKFTSGGVFITKWGTLGTGSGQFQFSRGVAIDSLGYVYVVDNGNTRIEKFTNTGTFLMEWGTNGSADGEFSNPYGITIDAFDHVFVADASPNDRIQEFNTSGDFITKWGGPGSGNGLFGSPIGVTTDTAGNVYVADVSLVQKFSPGGVFNWTVPNTITSLARIRVTAFDVGANNASDTSNAVFSIVSGGGGGSAPGRLSPSAPTALTGVATNTTSIRWNFTDTATNETGFRLYDDQNTRLMDVAQTDQSFIDETGLLPNTSYGGRTVKAYNDAGESSASSTFAAVATSMPSASVHVLSRDVSSLTVGINETLPNLDQGQSGVQFELIDALVAAAAATSPWLQTATYTFTNLQLDHTYSIRVHTRNVDGVETDWSQFIATSTLAQNEPKLEANLAVTLVGGGAVPTPLDPTKDLAVTVAVSNTGAGDATDVFLRLPIPAGLLVVPNTTVVDGIVQSVAADQDLAQLQNGVLSVIWPRLSPSDTVHVSFHLRFDLVFLSQLATATQASANPSFVLQASVSAKETTDISSSSTVTITPDLALLPTTITPPPAPTPTPTPVVPPTTPSTPPGSPAPTTPSSPSTPTSPTEPTPTSPTTNTTAEPGQVVDAFLTFVSDIGIMSGLHAVQEQVAAQQTPIQRTLTVSAPVLIISSIPLWGYLPYAPILTYQFFVWVFALFASKKKEGRSFGVVYDSIAKQPLPLAIVRVYKREGPQKKLITTVVTDKLGRYDALLQPGEYMFEVGKPAYTFPSKIVTTSEDGEHGSVYQMNKPFSVNAGSVSLPDVPLDPVNTKREFQLAGVLKKLWLVLQGLGNHLVVPLLVVGTVVSLINAMSVSNAINWVLAILYIILLSAQLKLRPTLLKAWGVVYEFATHAALPLTTIQLIDPATSKVVSSRLSDYEGRFSFLPEPGTYQVKASKPGFNQTNDGEQVRINKPNERITSDVPMQQQT